MLYCACILTDVLYIYYHIFMMFDHWHSDAEIVFGVKKNHIDIFICSLFVLLSVLEGLPY